MGNAIPFIEFGGNGPIIHFAHANGFPPKTYQHLIDELTANNQVLGMEARPLWNEFKPETFKTWLTGADDLIEFLDSKNLSGIIGMGHSFGAICTLIASIKRPDLFSSLVLIEPVILPKWYYPITKVLPVSIVKKINPVIGKTLNRTDTWSSKQVVFNQFRNKKVFGEIDDENLWHYVNAATISKNDKEHLRFSKEWEAQIYLTVTNVWGTLKKATHPMLVIRGETSDTIFPHVWQQMQQTNPSANYIEMNGCGHLVPLEKPQELAEIIEQFVSKTR